MQEPLKITLVKLLENKAYFLTEDKKEVILPKSALPEDLKVGAVLYLKIFEDSKENKISSENAKVLLEEILNE